MLQSLIYANAHLKMYRRLGLHVIMAGIMAIWCIKQCRPTSGSKDAEFKKIPFRKDEQAVETEITIFPSSQYKKNGKSLVSDILTGTCLAIYVFKILKGNYTDRNMNNIPHFLKFHSRFTVQKKLISRDYATKLRYTPSY